MQRNRPDPFPTPPPDPEAVLCARAYALILSWSCSKYGKLYPCQCNKSVRPKDDRQNGEAAHGSQTKPPRCWLECWPPNTEDAKGRLTVRGAQEATLSAEGSTPAECTLTTELTTGHFYE